MHCPHTTTSACYLLGVLPAAERQEFHRHAAGCTECRRGVDDLLPVVLLLWRTREHCGRPDEDHH